MYYPECLITSLYVLLNSDDKYSCLPLWMATFLLVESIYSMTIVINLSKSVVCNSKDYSYNIK